LIVDCNNDVKLIPLGVKAVPLPGWWGDYCVVLKGPGGEEAFISEFRQDLEKQKVGEVKP
jgi:hypothetical protein